MICTKHTLSPLSPPLSLLLTLSHAGKAQSDGQWEKKSRKTTAEIVQKWTSRRSGGISLSGSWLVVWSQSAITTCWTGTIQACYFCSLSRYFMKWWHTNHNPTQRQILQQYECIIWKSFPVVLWFEAICTPISFSHSSLPPGLPKPNEVIKRSPQGIIHFPNIT